MTTIPELSDYDDPADAESCMDCGAELLLSATVCAVDSGSVCIPCGKARYGEHAGNYLVVGAAGIPADFDAPIDCDECGHRHPGNDQHCPNCRQPASTGFHAIEPTERLKDCPVWIPGQGWVLAVAPDNDGQQ